MTDAPMNNPNDDAAAPTGEDVVKAGLNAAQQDMAEADAMAEAIKLACDQDPEAGDEAADLSVELAAEKDRLLRLQAEMENLRGRTAREVNDERRYAPLKVIRDLLPVVDNIDRAIEAAGKSADAGGSLLEGFKLVRQQLITVFDQHQCKQISAVGKPFDPQVHEAILQQPSDDQPANHVLMETQVGYQLHDRVIRPTQVIVSTGPAEG